MNTKTKIDVVPLNFSQNVHEHHTSIDEDKDKHTKTDMVASNFLSN